MILNNLTIRSASKEDVPDMLTLIKELALYENAPDEVINTEVQMLTDGFGDSPIFMAMVAELNGKIVGLSICYFRYSTWKGRCLYLEDLIVTEQLRRQGIGKALFDATIQLAKKENCNRLNWQVLDWNKSAIMFYEKYGSEFDSEWLNGYIQLHD